MIRTCFAGSLVEILIAFSIFAIVIASLLALRTTSKRQATVSFLEVQASNWARQAVTHLTSMPYEDLLLIRTRAVEDSALTTPSGFPGELSLKVVDADVSTPVPRMVRVSATVMWSPFGKNAREGRSSVTLERIAACPELALVQKLDP